MLPPGLVLSRRIQHSELARGRVIGSSGAAGVSGCDATAAVDNVPPEAGDAAAVASAEAPGISVGVLAVTQPESAAAASNASSERA
jgi:hypothetical protein